MYKSIPRVTKIHTGDFTEQAMFFKDNYNLGTLCALKEKVYGIHIDVNITEEEIKYSTRKKLITEDENISGLEFRELVKNDENKYRELFDHLTSRNPNIKEVIIRAELAGGLFGNEKTQPVNNDIHYSKSQFLYYYDIEIVSENIFGESGTNSLYLNPLESEYWFKYLELFTVPIIDILPFKEAIRYKHNINYVSLELSEKQLQAPEGFVIYPIKENRYIVETGERIIFKVINPEFEKVKNTKPEKKVAIKNPTADELEAYVTEQRLTSLLGNRGISYEDVSTKNVPMYILLMLEDIRKEKGTLSKLEKKFLMKRLGKLITEKFK